jgi:NAD(P)-dependent dehydrogenase (short-subunit alcohol dehydrogenase family)
MSVNELTGTNAIVTGASRGFGRAISISLAERGAKVVGVARNEELLGELKEQLGDSFIPEVADVTDQSLAARLISKYRPKTLVLNAGATPPVGVLSQQTWETFSTNWNVDVLHVFSFVREALRAPLDPGSTVVSLSSGAALPGSPMSGGYAGAKSTIRFISSYAGLEANRNQLDLRFVAVLPQLTSSTDLGRLYTEVYAAQAHMTETQFLEGRFGGALSVQQAGRGISDLVTDDAFTAEAYVLGAQGIQAIE